MDFYTLDFLQHFVVRLVSTFASQSSCLCSNARASFLCLALPLWRLLCVASRRGGGECSPQLFLSRAFLGPSFDATGLALRAVAAFSGEPQV